MLMQIFISKTVWPLCGYAMKVKQKRKKKQKKNSIRKIIYTYVSSSFVVVQIHFLP